MLHWRLSLGSLLILVLVSLFWLDMALAQPGIILFLIAIIVTIVACGEFVRLTTFPEFHSRAGTVYCGSLLVVFASGIPYFLSANLNFFPSSQMELLGLAFIAACTLAIVVEITSYREEENGVLNLGLSILGIFYIGMLIAVLVLLRFTGGDEWKSLPLIALLLTVKLGDIGAYTIGRILGKNRLAPRLSPGKTIEGVLGGLLFSIGGAFLAFQLLPAWIHLSVPPLQWWQIILFGLVVGGAGVLGDLAESLLKRCADQKDSSSWLPGFGGVLDLMDSLLLAGPVSLLFWRLVLG